MVHLMKQKKPCLEVYWFLLLEFSFFAFFLKRKERVSFLEFDVPLKADATFMA